MAKPTGFMDYDRKTSSSIKPTERIKNFNEFHILLPKEERKIQGARCMDCGVPFCQSGIMLGGMTSGCPINNLIPEWNDSIYTDNSKEALERLLMTNNFPEFTGRVCPAPCEVACTCNVATTPVAIKENELSIIENGFEEGLIKSNPPKVRTGKKIAIIGSGPAGLSAADSLNKRGHMVTVFERSDRIGGLLMYGIPNMKLEKSIIDRRINLMTEEGVVFVTNADIGKNYQVSKLKKEFDRIILACGASNPRDIKVSGREGKGIYFAVDYLKGVTKSLLDSSFADKACIDTKGKNVLVIGGGDTGNDCVGTAIRQGAKSVLQLEMMPMPSLTRTEDNPWPQWPKVLKVDYGQEEAIAVFGKDPRVYQSTVKEFILDKNGNLSKVKIVKLESKYHEEVKRYQMDEIPGSEYEVDMDYAFIAAGFLGTENYVAKAFGIELNERTNVATSVESYDTNVPNVFVAGDMHRGQSLVVWAIREGREVAREVDKHLMGYSNLN